MGQPNKNWRRNDELSLSKQDSKVGTSSSFTKPTSGAADAKRSLGGSRSKAPDEKLPALMAYRKAKGL